MSKPRTICANCAFCRVNLLSTDPDAPRTRLNYRCTAVLHDKIIDPVTGKEVYVTHEAKFITEEKHPNCIDMNANGDCPVYLGAEG